MTNSSSNLVLFASGGGSNAVKIIQYFEHHPKIKVAAIICNNDQAGIIHKAAEYNIPCEIINKKKLNDPVYMGELLNCYNANFLILAGFLLLVPAYLIKNYPDRIINIHPSLLPKYGGKGMHGIHIHQAVIEAKEEFSGITIHLVNEEYDKGEVLFQTSIEITTDSPQDLATEILKLEHLHFSQVIEKYVLSHNS
jgi:phosphoribosylglycinamide formyltransferase 1